MGVIGLQLGVGIAIALQFLTNVIILMKSNWQSIADEANQRIEDNIKDLKVAE